MKKAICLLISAVILSAVSCFADEIPTGFSPLSEIKNVQAKAALEGKLVVIVIRGRGGNNAHDDAIFKTGVTSLGGGVEKIFTRPDEINGASQTDFPQVLRDRLKKEKFTKGAACTFVVFDPKMTQIVVEEEGGNLWEDRKLNLEFKKKIQEAKKTLK